MENHEKENPAQQASSPNSSTSSSSTSAAAVAPSCTAAAVQPASPAPPPPLTPKSVHRPGDSANPYPTTFVQADTSSFKQVVQMLTGSAETTAKHAAAGNNTNSNINGNNTKPVAAPPPPLPAAKATAPKRQAFKLYERRSSLRNLKVISPLVPELASPRGFSSRKQPEILSPSMLDFPSLVLSPVTPLIPDPFNRLPPHSAAATAAEERAIAEKGFYLHPSPRSTGAEPPRLLPLFPVTSPRAAASSP